MRELFSTKRDDAHSDASRKRKLGGGDWPTRKFGITG